MLSQNIGKTNNIKAFVSNETKGLYKSNNNRMVYD